MSSKTFVMLGAAALLGGCQSVDPVSQSPDPHFGEATAWNKEVQIIDPDPAYPANGARPGADGERAAAAVERYKQGQVKETQPIAVGTGSGGSNSGSGSSPR